MLTLKKYEEKEKMMKQISNHRNRCRRRVNVMNVPNEGKEKK